MKPFFSIIIPTLNEEKFLPSLLNDLVRQKSRDFEVIIVDGRSEDKTEQIVSNLKDFPISFYQVKKRNVSYQRNFGAQKALGSYLVFLDADSGILPSFTARTKQTINKRPGLFFLPYLYSTEKNPEIKFVFNLVNLAIDLSQNLKTPFSSGGAMIVERNFFNCLGGFNEKLFLAEDHNLVKRAMEWGVRAKFAKNIKVKFSLRRMKKEGQLTYISKYLIASLHLLIRGDIKKKIFEYQMAGGQVYDEADKKLPIEQVLKNSLRRVKKFIQEI